MGTKIKKYWHTHGEFIKKHPAAVSLGLALEVMEQRICALCMEDENYRQELKIINDRYDEDVRKLQEKYTEKYISEGRLRI